MSRLLVVILILGLSACATTKPAPPKTKEVSCQWGSLHMISSPKKVVVLVHCEKDLARYRFTFEMFLGTRIDYDVRPRIVPRKNPSGPIREARRPRRQGTQ